MKRVRWEVRYSRYYEAWGIFCDGVLGVETRKIDAIRRAARDCRRNLKAFGELSELTVKRRDGTIQDKRTYGRDPRKTRG